MATIAEIREMRPRRRRPGHRRRLRSTTPPSVPPAAGRDGLPRCPSTSASAAPCAPATATPCATATTWPCRSTPTASTTPATSRRLVARLDAADVVIGARFATARRPLQGARTAPLGDGAARRGCCPGWRTTRLTDVTSRLPGRPTAARSPCSPPTTPPSTSATPSSRWSSPCAPGCTVTQVPVDDAGPRGRPSRQHSPIRAAVYLCRARRRPRACALVRQLRRPTDEGATRPARRGPPVSQPSAKAVSGVNVLGMAGSVIILLALFEMMRRHRLREKYALIWVLVALGVTRRSRLFPRAPAARTVAASACRCRPTCCSSSPRWCCWC